MSWTKEEKEQLRVNHTAQMTVSEIAEKMQKKKSDVRKQLCEMGYLPKEIHQPAESEFLKGKEPVKVGRKPYAKITPEIEQKVCELSGQGKSQMQIAIKLGICLSSVKRIMQKHKADKPSKINEDFEAAVDEMIAEAREEKAMTVTEKEPAPSANDASSKQDITPVIPVINDTTNKTESQAPALTGIKMMMEIEAMLGEVYGRDAEIIDINANGDHCDIGFTYHGREYSMLFAEREEVPDYGNDKH